MLQIHSLNHDASTSNRNTRSHVLTPHDAVTILCIIDGSNKSAVSVIEDHLLESISSTEWQEKDIQEDFSFVTESYNAFVAKMVPVDIEDVRIVLGVLTGHDATFTNIGKSLCFLVESTMDITDISVKENTGHFFQAISHGKIPKNGIIYIANDNLEDLLGDEVLIEFSKMNASSWSETAYRIISQEVASNLHMIRISRKECDQINDKRSGGNKRQQVSLFVKAKGKATVEYFRNKQFLEKAKNITQKIPLLEKGKYQYAFLGVGIIILFSLIYILISSIAGVINPGTSDSRNLIIQASVLVDEGQKLMANPQAFNAKILEAEKILFELRKDNSQLKDSQELLSKIASMKKEVHGIQTIDVESLGNIITFDPSSMSPLGIFQKNNKFNLIGTKGSLMEHIPGNNENKLIPYPGNETLQKFHASDNGSVIYGLTQNNTILTARRDGFNYVKVSGQPSWEDAIDIQTFNGNIYLLNAQGNQIMRHKPGINGFSQQSLVLKKIFPGIVGFSIDGGVYLYMQDGKIYHAVGGVIDKPLMLNKIPGEWTFDPTKRSQYITKSNLSYTYILNGNNVWIFKPNSRRFQDVTAWEYVAQIELKSQNEIRAIDVPRDGSIFVVSSIGVYEIRFDMSDGKIIFK